MLSCLYNFGTLIRFNEFIKYKLNVASFEYPNISCSRYLNLRDVVNPNGSKMNIPVLLFVNLTSYLLSVMCLRSDI